MLDSSEIMMDALTSIQNHDAPADLTKATQIELEILYSKYQLHHCISEYFHEIGAAESCAEIEMDPGFGIDLLTQMVLHKRADIPTLVRLLKKHFEDMPNPAQVCADMIHLACENDMIDWDQIAKVMVIRYDIPEELQLKLDQFQYPLPMIEPPVTVLNNRSTGYRTIRGSLILRNNHHEDDICLDHINRVNSIPLSVNTDVVAFVQNQWRNLDKPKQGESKEKFLARKRAFEKYDRSSRDVISAMLAQGNRFWLTHRYDKRGRTYASGYHVNYQGTDWNKACICFADPEPIKE